jgi:alpha-ketoglutarate-dependent taurine dioxygenase
MSGSELRPLTEIIKRPDQALLDIPQEEILCQLQACGAVLLRGFEFPDSSFSVLSEKFSSHFFNHGKRAVVFDKYSIEVVPGNARVAPHCEFGYTPFAPDYVWLLCRVPPSEGGNTLTFDGKAFFTALSRDTQERFLSQRIIYHHRWSPRLVQGFWPGKTIAEIRAFLATTSGVLLLPDCDDKVLRFDYITSALRTLPDGCPLFLNSVMNIVDTMRKGDANATILFEDGEPLPGTLIDELEAVAKQVVQVVRWQARDILLIDNSRAMHGREAFRGPRDIVARIGTNTAHPWF